MHQRKWGRGKQAFNTFPLRITYKKEEGVQISCKNASVINGRPLGNNFHVLLLSNVQINNLILLLHTSETDLSQLFPTQAHTVFQPNTPVTPESFCHQSSRTS